MWLVRCKYRKLVRGQKLVPNVSVLVPNPRGDLKGHPCHLYYTVRCLRSHSFLILFLLGLTGLCLAVLLLVSSGASAAQQIPYDCTGSDVRLQGALRGAFAYTSVTAYDDASLPVPHFRFDETLIADATAAVISGEPLGISNTASSSGPAPGDRYTLWLTVEPQHRPGINEMDVSSCPRGVVLIRLIYPEVDGEVERCRPRVCAVASGSRKFPPWD